MQIPARDMFVYANKVTVNLCSPGQYDGRGKLLETGPHGKTPFTVIFVIGANPKKLTEDFKTYERAAEVGSLS